MTLFLAITAGVLAYVAAAMFDWASLSRTPVAKRILVPLFLALHGFALYAALSSPGELNIPHVLSIAGWVLLPISSFLLAYSLLLDLPPGQTYSKRGSPGHLVASGTYALVRHPGVLWYVLLMAPLVMATRSVTLLWAAPVWCLMDVSYAVLQDRVLFPRMFPGYSEYRKQVPMLFPTSRSIGACLRTFRFREVPDIMTKLISAMIAAALMVTLLPGTALGSSKHTVTAAARVVAIQRDVNQVGLGPGGSIHLAGTATYAGVVTSATRKGKGWDKLAGASIMAGEEVDYLIDGTGNIIAGKAKGKMTILANDGSILIIEVASKVTGNVITGPAQDTGEWEVISASGSLRILKEAEGKWTATVAPSVVGKQLTLAGTALMTGSY